MSFSVLGTLSMSSDLGPQVDAIFDEAAARDHAGVLAEVARDVALKVAPNVAGPEDRVTFSAYGHYNGGVEAKEGWASNALTVQLTQVYGPAEAEG